MADTDEAVAHSGDPAPQVEVDLSDETQDFRFLNTLSIFSDPSNATLPRRGEKDFEPNPTLHQADTLTASRQAMHNALAHPRLHNPRNKVTGVFAPDGPSPPANTQAKPRGGEIVIPRDACVYVTNPKGQFFKAMGKADSWGRVWLFPEEALYLLERGSLDIRWPGEEIPMSLQAGYACFLGRGGLSSERYQVFTGLKRLGYSLLRAPGWDDTSEHESAGCTEVKWSGFGMGVFGKLWEWLYTSNTTATGPVIGLGIHRSFNDIFRRLAMIPWYDPVPPKPKPKQPEPPFRIVFHVFKPATPFKKSAPPPPDFRLAVINAHSQATIPTLSQLGTLLESTPLDPPRGEKMDRLMYMRLRHGQRNVVLAIVDQGVVSYLRMGDAAFGKEKIYKDKMMGGNKKGFHPRRQPNKR